MASLAMADVFPNRTIQTWWVRRQWNAYVMLSGFHHLLWSKTHMFYGFALGFFVTSNCLPVPTLIEADLSFGNIFQLRFLYYLSFRISAMDSRQISSECRPWPSLHHCTFLNPESVCWGTILSMKWGILDEMIPSTFEDVEVVTKNGAWLCSHKCTFI